MIDQRTAPYAAFVLRIAIGILFLAHFYLKFFIFTPSGTDSFFASLGLPSWLAYITMAVELLGGFALILGIYTRIVSLLLIPILLGAVLKVHGATGFFFTNPNGGWEFPVFWIITLVSLALIGEGKYALKPSSRQNSGE